MGPKISRRQRVWLSFLIINLLSKFQNAKASSLAFRGKIDRSKISTGKALLFGRKSISQNFNDFKEYSFPFWQKNRWVQIFPTSKATALPLVKIDEFENFPVYYLAFSQKIDKSKNSSISKGIALLLATKSTGQTLTQFQR